MITTRATSTAIGAKAIGLTWVPVFLIVGLVVWQLPAQQSEPDFNLLAKIRAKAENGDAKSQFELGKAFFQGELGVAKDYVEAVKWYRKAAAQNVASAQISLGACYANDYGVARDYVEAYKWFLIASAQGCEGARERLTTMETRMSRDQIAKAQKLARPYNAETISFTSTSGNAVTNAEVVRVVENAYVVWRQGASAGMVRVADLPEDLRSRFGYPEHSRVCRGFQVAPARSGTK